MKKHSHYNLVAFLRDVFYKHFSGIYPHCLQFFQKSFKVGIVRNNSSIFYGDKFISVFPVDLIVVFVESYAIRLELLQQNMLLQLKIP